MKALTVAVAVLLLSGPAFGRGKKDPDAKKKGHSAKGTLLLNGEKTEVNWSDGDSFKILDGPYKGAGTRMVGYNSLEGYGPVHRWGSWTAQELYELAKESSLVGASQEWKCTTDGNVDGYRRVLINCPEAAKEFIRQGHGMVYAVEDTKPDPELLKLQKEAQDKKVGMWAKGVPNGIITSLHSVGEEGGKSDTAYDRVADTRTGEAHKRAHHQRYTSCQEVCHETDGNQSCMVFVPFQNRYKNRADCLKEGYSKTP